MGECDWDLVWLIVLNYYIYVVCLLLYILIMKWYGLFVNILIIY